MRDVKDPGTIEMALARKPGRPPKHGKAMSAAERMRIYRKTKAHTVRRFQYWMIAEYSDVLLLDALRDDIQRGNAEGVKAILAELARRHANV